LPLMETASSPVQGAIEDVHKAARLGTRGLCGSKETSAA